MKFGLQKKEATSGHLTFQYGCHIGNFGFRVAVAKFLSDQYRDEVD